MAQNARAGANLFTGTAPARAIYFCIVRECDANPRTITKIGKQFVGPPHACLRGYKGAGPLAETVLFIGHIAR